MASERMIRVTHREREDTVERLRGAYADGCLDDGELEERTSLAYAAKTRGQLAGLISDLPAPPRADVPGVVATMPSLADLARRARRFLGWGSLLMLTSAGAWLIAIVAGGIAALPLIFLWLVACRACGHLSRQRRSSGRAVEHAAAHAGSFLIPRTDEAADRW